MDVTSLKFLTNEAGEKEGLGDAGIETFRDSPYASCAREAGQNARDAENASPVRMTFNVLHLEKDSFPSRGSLEEAIRACKNEASQEREKEFFKNALAVICKEQIPVLEIADYNTKGLVGPPHKEGTPFHSLVKGAGVTAKETADSGGSFGIGKNASFAISDLHTVFYTTNWNDQTTGSVEFAAQGKTKLVSHQGPKGSKLRATGYWGHPEGFEAVTDKTLVPEWMKRKEVGTSIFCMGFRLADDWAERMTLSLISNFFCAIHREQMEFTVDNDRISINHNTIENLLIRQEILNAAENAGLQSDVSFAKQLYRCLISEQAEEETIEISQLGKVRVRILLEEDMPRRVGFVRNGMLITDNLQHFGHPLARFPGSRDFVVLVEPYDSATSAFLKTLENPSHDGFSAERITDSEKRKVATQAVKSLGKKLREIIKKTTGVKHEGSVVLDELGRYFAETGDGNLPQGPNSESDPERYTYETKPRKAKTAPRAPAQFQGPNGGGSNTGSGSGGDGGGQGNGTGSGKGGQGTKGDREYARLDDVRNRIRADVSGYAVSRELHFTPESEGRIELTVEAIGIDKPERLCIKKGNAGVVKGGNLIVEVRAHERTSVTVTFDEPYDGPIELLAVSHSEAEETGA